MAKTRNKRQTKHRGNAAGVVESRGRTGRKPTSAEKSGSATSSAAARKKEIDRRDKPPTWRAAFYKAMIATVLLLFVILVFLKGSSGAIALFPIVLGALHGGELLHRQVGVRAPPAQEGSRRQGADAVSTPDVRSYTVGPGAGELPHRAGRRAVGPGGDRRSGR